MHTGKLDALATCPHPLTANDVPIEFHSEDSCFVKLTGTD